MSPVTSAFLDVLRIAAALVVFVNHCAQFWSPRAFAVTAPIAHGAVVVFFVLSGYVIAYSTLSREQGVKRYTVARLSRLYSVVIPALLLTWLLQSIGNGINPAFYSHFPRTFDLSRFLLTGCFLQNVWTFSASPPTNAPLWSLSYEFWYYVLFGVAILGRRGFLRGFILLVLSLIAGPNILLLLPCWWLGVVLFTFRERLVAVLPHPRWCFALFLPLMLSAIVLLPPFPYDLGHKGWWYSGAFLTDWLTALTVGAVIVSFEASKYSPLPPRAASLIRHGADHTFSLYLYHYPLIAFATAVIPFNPSAWWQTLCVATGVLAIVWCLSLVTEARRRHWRTAFEWMFDRLAFRLTSPAVNRA